MEMPDPPHPPLSGRHGLADTILASAAALAMLLAFIVVRRRKPTAERESTRRSARVSYTVGVATLPPLIVIASSTVLLSSSGGPRIALLRIAIATIIAGLYHLVMIWLADVLSTRLGARHSREWLPFACVVLPAAILLIPSAFTLAISGPAPLLTWQMLAVFVIAEAAALIWWAHLPAADGAVADIFR
jgi:hypothetical protein